MKKTTTKLRLTSTTLRLLDAPALSQVAGGAMTQWYRYCGNSDLTCDTCTAGASACACQSVPSYCAC